MTETDEYGRTPLHNAVIDKELVRVKELLAAGADVNARDRENWSPLHYAAQDHSLDIARLLVDAGAAIDAQDAEGNTPLWRAVMNAYHGDALIEFLKDLGANPEIENNHGISPKDLEDDSA